MFPLPHAGFVTLEKQKRKAFHFSPSQTDDSKTTTKAAPSNPDTDQTSTTNHTILRSQDNQTEGTARPLNDLLNGRFAELDLNSSVLPSNSGNRASTVSTFRPF